MMKVLRTIYLAVLAIALTANVSTVKAAPADKAQEPNIVELRSQVPDYIKEEYAASHKAGSRANEAKVYKWTLNDPYGISMTVIAMGIVFVALIILYISFRTIGKINERGQKKAAAATADSTHVEVKVPAQGSKDEVIAAIALALSQALYAHDEESDVLTIARSNSAWGDKNATLRITPTK